MSKSVKNVTPAPSAKKNRKTKDDRETPTAPAFRTAVDRNTRTRRVLEFIGRNPAAYGAQVAEAVYDDPTNISVYRVLHRLRDSGLVKVEERPAESGGNNRQCYSITSSGRAVLNS